MTAASTSRPAPRGESTWQPVCRLDRILRDAGVAVRVDGHPVAVFRLADDRVRAVDHTDPFTGANVLARGLVGDHDGVPTVASPLHKQRFSLIDGRCLDDPAVAVGVHRARVSDGVIEVALDRTAPPVPQPRS